MSQKNKLSYNEEIKKLEGLHDLNEEFLDNINLLFNLKI